MAARSVARGSARLENFTPQGYDGGMSTHPKQLPVVLHSGEDGWVVAECPVIPGCISQGRSRDEALQNIREAIDLCLETQDDEGWTVPKQYELVDLRIG